MAYLTGRRNFLKLVTASLAGLTSLSLSAAPSFAEAIKGISYGRNKLDIYKPANASNSPIIMYVHGGAWRLGNKRKVGSKAKYYNRNGYIFVSVGYTLYPRANAEQQAVQVAQAVNWMKKNAGAYGGDGSRIALMGHSAGCHLATMATLSGATTPKLLISNDTGAYDLAFLAKVNGGRIPRLYSPLNKRSKWRRWSPISYVYNRQQPPSLVIWSGGKNRDKISKHYANVLSKAGNPVTHFDGSSYSHLSINSSIGRSSNSVTNAIDRFLQQL